MPQEYVKNIGRNITRLRAMRGMTKVQLADALDVARSTVTMWEQGKSYPRVDTIEKMAEFFNVPKSAILDENEDEVSANIERVNTNPSEKFESAVMDAINKSGDSPVYFTIGDGKSAPKKFAIVLDDILNENSIVVYGGKVLNMDQRKQLNTILKGLFPNG
jgi:transcriptional regulator with XRE-family HTH domain